MRAKSVTLAKFHSLGSGSRPGDDVGNRAFIEEAPFFPFAPHDDLIGVCSRVYDIQPVPASK